MKKKDKVVWIDKKGNKKGIVTRTQAHTKGLLHQISVVYLINERKEVLVQQRADNNKYDHSAAGHVDPGESVLEAAQRELLEELGVANVLLSEVGETVLENTNWGPYDRVKHLYTIYYCQAKPVKLDPHEVKQVVWKKPSHILKEMEEDKAHVRYTPGFKITFGYFLKHVFKD